MSRESSWKRLCDEIDRDVWEETYKIAAKKIKVLEHVIMSDEEKQKHVEELFPNAKRWNGRN